MTFNSFRDFIRDCKKVYHGFKVLRKDKRTPEESYLAMRNLFVKTNGLSNDVISRLIRHRKYERISPSGVLGIKGGTHLKQIVQSIERNGFHVFSSTLPESTVQKIYDFAVQTPCNYIEAESNFDTTTKQAPVLFDESRPISPRYDFTQNQILSCKELVELIFDSSILAVAQSYLNTKPILDLVAMWWSAPFHGAAKSAAAQMYHFDLDRIKFLKFFFYLTDVTPETGPHCYVRGSHKRLPKSLLKDGRHLDETVKKEFGEENMLELSGVKGSILAVDTRGLHKGKDLTRDKRLLFQIEFANSMFGQYYEPCKKPILPVELEDRYSKFNYTYKEIIL